MRRQLIVLISSVVLVGAACGGEGAEISSTDVPETSVTVASGGDAQRVAIIESLTATDGLGVTEESAGCVADGVIGVVSDEGIAELSDPFGEFANMAADDSAAVVAAMDDCIEFAEIQDGLVTSLAAELSMTELSEQEIDCVGVELENEYGGVGRMAAEIEASDESQFSVQIAGLFGGCLRTETVAAFVAANFTGQGLTEAEGSCVANALVFEFGGSRLFEMLAGAGLSGGELPADLESALTTAATGCAGVGATTGGGDVGSGIGQ